MYSAVSMVVFAHGDGAHSGGSASILDLSTGASMTIGGIWSRSEPLCVQFRTSPHALVFGHRNGSVTSIDTRSPGASCRSAPSSSGSITNIQSLQDDKLVVVRSSFGSCRVLDVRRFSNSRDPSQCPRSIAVDLSLPESMVHQTKSVRCTGMALDPTNTVAIAPFASIKDDLRFAFWDVTSGELIRTLRLDRLRNSSDSTRGLQPAAFCELSSVVTPGYEMLCKKDCESPLIVSGFSGSWGLWFKTGDCSTPQNGGGIHHIKF